jgi:hypothetical protein
MALALAGCGRAGAQEQPSDAAAANDRPPAAAAPGYDAEGQPATGSAAPGATASSSSPLPSGETSSSSAATNPFAIPSSPNTGGQGGGNNSAMPDSCNALFEEVPGNKLRVTVSAEVPAGKTFYSGPTVDDPMLMARVYEGGDFTIPYPRKPIAIVAVGGVALQPGANGSFGVDIGQPVVFCGNFQP